MTIAQGRLDRNQGCTAPVAQLNMADLTLVEKTTLEKLLGMSSGYVLDLTNNTLADLVLQSTGKDIFSNEYEFQSGSKANRLRAFWRREPNDVVGKLIAELLEYWRLTKGDRENDELYRECSKVAARLREQLAASGTCEAQPQPPLSPDGPCGDRVNRSTNATTTPVLGRDPYTPEDRKFAELAIAEARRSVSEGDERPHPKVGAVVVRDGQVLSVAHRGEISGCHAEYIALERKLEEVPLAGATVYTTLEPCTERNHPKVPCARRLVERKVRRVVIGMLDPNPKITGRGQLLLREANIITDLFPHDLMAQVEELNREFNRAYRAHTLNPVAKPTGQPDVMAESIATPLHSTNDISRATVATDRVTLADLLDVLPSGGAINFLRSNNFAGFPFRWEELKDLDRFFYERSGPDHEFLDPELETLRQDLLRKCRSFTDYLGLNTWRISSNVEYASVPQEWELDQPERFERVVKAIHSQAQAVCDAYDQLIRTARRTLLA